MTDIVSRITGIRNHCLLELYGVREIATGIAILSSTERAPGMWARVVGDGLDLIALGEAVKDSRRSGRTRSLMSILAVAGVTALDIASAIALDEARSRQC